MFFHFRKTGIKVVTEVIAHFGEPGASLRKERKVKSENPIVLWFFVSYRSNFLTF